MKLKNFATVLLLSASSFMFSTGCKSKPKDADIKASVETAVANASVNVAVNEAKVMLTGTVQDDAAKNAAETAAKGVKDVTDVTNSITVMPVQAPQAPVNISNDTALESGIDAITKQYNTVKATVNDGVVTLTGNIKRDQLPRLMQAIMALRPKNIDNKLTVK